MDIDNEIREAWEKDPANSGWDEVENADDVKDHCYAWFEAGYKAAQKTTSNSSLTGEQNER